jgi:hypothetical protein
MALDKDKISKKAYEPYFREAGHCFANFILISILVAIVFLSITYATGDNVISAALFIVAFYLVLDAIFNYRLSFLAMYEKRKCDWEKQNLVIDKIISEDTWTARLGESVIYKLYPKELHVYRYKLICYNQSGDKVVLRAVMSAKKYRIIQDRIFNSMSTDCIIYYGKLTRIVMMFKNQELWTDKLNHMF